MMTDPDQILDDALSPPLPEEGEARDGLEEDAAALAGLKASALRAAGFDVNANEPKLRLISAIAILSAVRSTETGVARVISTVGMWIAGARLLFATLADLPGYISQARDVIATLRPPREEAPTASSPAPSDPENPSDPEPPSPSLSSVQTDESVNVETQFTPIS